MAAHDRDKGAARNARLKAAQSVSFFDTASGMGALFGQWDPEGAASVENAVDAIAEQLWRAEHPDRNPTRHEATSLKFRRAEAVLEMARRTLAGTLAADAVNADVDDGDAPLSRPGPVARPLVSLLMDYHTLIGELRGKGICELFDGPPISPDTARRLACDAAIIPMVLGSRGEVLNQGRRIYLPTKAQRHALWIRDRHCAFPGCRRPAKWTKAHHIVPFIPYGLTDMDNMLLLCDNHHHLVHEGGWHLTGTAMDFTIHRPDGTLFEHITRGPP